MICNAWWTSYLKHTIFVLCTEYYHVLKVFSQGGWGFWILFVHGDLPHPKIMCKKLMSLSFFKVCTGHPISILSYQTIKKCNDQMEGWNCTLCLQRICIICVKFRKDIGTYKISISTIFITNKINQQNIFFVKLIGTYMYIYKYTHI